MATSPKFQLRDSSGTVIFDSDTVYAACIGQLVTIAAGATPTYTFPNHAGRTVFVTYTDGQKATGHTIDTALGYPRVIFSAGAFDRDIAIWIM